MSAIKEEKKKLGFGLMRLPEKNGAVDVEESMKLMDAFMAKGFTYFDTAYIYGDGQSERAFRESVVKRYPREAFTITDKIPCMMLEREETAIPCTGCRYCVSECPMKIAIPDYFSVYNNLKRFGMKSDSDIWNYFLNLIKIHGKPSDCIECGMCESRCPQKLTIRQYLKVITEEVENRFA